MGSLLSFCISKFLRVLSLFFRPCGLDCISRAVWIRHEVVFAFEELVLLGNNLLAEFFVFFPVLTLTVSVAVGSALAAAAFAKTLRFISAMITIVNEYGCHGLVFVNNS